MERKKNERFTVRIQDSSEDGAGIGKVDGYIWFIKDTVIGDLVEASVMKTKKSYGFARALRILEPSPFRVEPRCPVAKACGGCSLQAMSYEEQLRFKERKIRDALERIGGVKQLTMEPIMGMEDPWRYRNKAQFPVGKDKTGRVIFGFYADRSHTIIENEDCFLGVEENKQILQVVRAYMERFGITPYDEEDHRGLVRHVLIRKGFRTGELMVCLVINGETLPHEEWLVEELVREIDDPKNDLSGTESSSSDPEKDRGHIVSISYNINMEKTNVILGHKVVDLYGPGYITDYIGAIRYQISPLSFYQVNPVQTEKLYGTALEYAGLTGEEAVWDLYCGIGTISLFLAQRAKKVYGVEIVPAAIEDARRNAELNGIENVEFFVGKAEEVLPWAYRERGAYADVVVVDPPRKGCDKVCLDTIVEMGAERVVYVSCDPATLARDVKYLGEKGYEVVKGRGCDMFPGTGHVETVCLLSKLKTEHHIEIDLNLDELDLTAAESKATYDEIKAYVLEKFGLKVSSLYISQVKRKCGLEVGESYNQPKSENAKVPTCPPEKEKAIMAALEHFQMIEGSDRK